MRSFFRQLGKMTPALFLILALLSSASAEPPTTPSLILQEFAQFQMDARDAILARPPETTEDLQGIQSALLLRPVSALMSEVDWMKKSLRKTERHLDTMLGHKRAPQEFLKIKLRAQQMNERLSAALLQREISSETFLDLFVEFTALTSHVLSTRSVSGLSSWEVERAQQSLMLGIGGRGIKYYKSLFPFLILLPSYQPLRIQDLNLESLVALGFVGITAEPLYADGHQRFGLSFSHHDLQHIYFSKREVILAIERYQALLAQVLPADSAKEALQKLFDEIDAILARNQIYFESFSRLKAAHPKKLAQIMDILWFDIFHEGFRARTEQADPFSTYTSMVAAKKRRFATALIRRLRTEGDLKGTVTSTISPEDILKAMELIVEHFSTDAGVESLLKSKQKNQCALLAAG